MGLVIPGAELDSAAWMSGAQSQVPHVYEQMCPPDFFLQGSGGMVVLFFNDQSGSPLYLHMRPFIEASPLTRLTLVFGEIESTFALDSKEELAKILRVSRLPRQLFRQDRSLPPTVFLDEPSYSHPNRSLKSRCLRRTMTAQLGTGRAAVYPE